MRNNSNAHLSNHKQNRQESVCNSGDQINNSRTEEIKRMLMEEVAGSVVMS